MKIVPISLPTPFYIGPVNVYLIAEDPITIIDTGPKTEAAVSALRDGLKRAGFAVADIRRIVLTHAHEDHCGLARALRDEAKDAQVFVHGWETGHRAGRLEHDENLRLLTQAGVPPEEIGGMRRLYESVREYADSLDDDHCSELHDGDDLEFATGILRVLHTPGHTPGSCSFVREADRTVIAGDCLLKRITPNPMLSPDRYLRAIRERQSDVIRLVPKTGATAWEVSRGLFPDTDDVHRFLAVSEAVAHLDQAHSEGKIGLEISDGCEVYRRLSAE